MRNTAFGAMLVLLGLASALSAAGEVRTAGFDRDPGWEGRNNRSQAVAPRQVRQDFGYSPTRHARGGAGEIGGYVSPAAEPAYYARPIPKKTLDDPLSASGTLACTGRQFHLLLGFFNTRTLNEWRTPNTLALRLQGRGDHFYAYVEYCTSRWRAGGDSPGGFAKVPDPETGRQQLRGFASEGILHKWSLQYDPEAAGGRGALTVTLDGETSICELDPGHRADGASFNRFGMLNVLKSADDGGEVWMDDVTVLGQTDHFDREAGWEGSGNRRTYASTNVRPRFDFGYSLTHYAGGKAAGEIGGTIFRGDCRYPERMAAYGDRLLPLTPERELHASGKICLRRGVTDSTVLLGFYSSTESLKVNGAQTDGMPRSFLGVMIEGPSRDGFLFRPACRFSAGSEVARDEGAPPIYPDGKPHAWSLSYSPPADGKPGRVEVTLDGQPVTLELKADGAGIRFDRFGIVTTWIDGNAQEVYFDDLAFTGG